MVGGTLSAGYTHGMSPERNTHDTPRPWTGRAILHVDLDAFFASVEQLDHPEWRGLPVIVGGSPEGRGVVSTASYEARAFGVHSAMPSARAKMLCPDAIWARGRFDRYHEMSQKVMSILMDETPLMQQVSVDEAFLDVTPGRFRDDDPVRIAERIRARVAETGMSVSVGVASSKSVAKIASDFHKPDGLTVVYPGEEAEFLRPLPVRAMSGIGPRTAERLRTLGIATLGDLAALDDDTASQLMGTHGRAVVARAGGRDSSQVVSARGVKSVSNERTFATDVRTPAEVSGALAALCAKVASRLRKRGLKGRTVTVKLRFSDFTTRTVQRTLDHPVDDEALFGDVAFELLREAWTPGVGLRLLGVGLSGFREAAAQLDLLESGTTDARRLREELVAGIDAVRERFGADALRFGDQIRRDDDDEDE